MLDLGILAIQVIDVFVVKAGVIGWLIWLLSIVVVGLSVNFFLQIRRATILPDEIKAQIQEMFSAKQYREVIDMTEGQSDMLSYMIHSALTEAPHGYPAMERAMEEAAEEQTTKLLRKIEWLNLIGNIGPMMGLLGTVWGMIGAFFTIVEKGTPNPADLANDIGVALVTTMLGLCVAIPAMSVYAIMRNKIDALSSEAILVSQEMISTFRPTARKSG